MKSTFSVTEAQASLPEIVRAEKVVAISRRQKVAGFYVPRDRFESLIETMELLANPSAMKALRAARAGKVKYRDLEDVEKELGL